MFKRPLYQTKDRTKFKSKKIVNIVKQNTQNIINVSTFTYCPIFGIKYKIIQVYEKTNL